MFNEGYKSSDANKYIRVEFCAESIRLGEILIGHTGDQEPTLHALLALFYFQSCRLPARLTDRGTINLLKDQNRSLWDKRLLAKGFAHFKSATQSKTFSRYYLEASIAGYHCAAPSFEETDWKSILRLYDTLLRHYQTPVIQLNRAIALGHIQGPHEAIKSLKEIEREGTLKNYFLLPATLGEFYSQVADIKQAHSYLEEALSLSQTETEKVLIRSKIEALKI